jgi:hypothetical protein
MIYEHIHPTVVGTSATNQEKENLKLTCATSGDPKPTVR